MKVSLRNKRQCSWVRFVITYRNTKAIWSPCILFNGNVTDLTVGDFRCSQRYSVRQKTLIHSFRPVIISTLHQWNGFLTENFICIKKNRFTVHTIFSNCSTNLQKIFRSIQFMIAVGRDSSVGIARRYGLEDTGIESWWGARFSAPVQTGPGVHPRYRILPGG
jgi:hypothetical protein